MGEASAIGWQLDPLTIGGALARAADRFSNADALVIDGRRASHAALFAETIERARGLIGLGVGPGDHVGILMPNCWDAVILADAAALIGARR